VSKKTLFAFGDVFVPPSAVEHITKVDGLPHGYHSITFEHKHKTFLCKVKYLPYKSLKPKERPYKKRSNIIKFSFSSQRRLKDKLLNCMWMMKAECTLTYPNEYSSDGLVIKNHLKQFTQWLTRLGYKWLWVLEFQERGAPHFHFAIDGDLDKQVLAERWYKIVNSGDEKHLRAGTSINRIRRQYGYGRYLSKYYGKLKSKEVPVEYQNVGRFWGASNRIDGNEVTEILCSRQDTEKFVHSELFVILRKWNKHQRKGWKRKKKKIRNPYFDPTAGFKLFNPDPILRELEKRDMLPFYIKRRDLGLSI